MNMELKELFPSLKYCLYNYVPGTAIVFMYLLFGFVQEQKRNNLLWKWTEKLKCATVFGKGTWGVQYQTQIVPLSHDLLYTVASHLLPESKMLPKKEKKRMQLFLDKNFGGHNIEPRYSTFAWITA